MQKVREECDNHDKDL